jgi:low temperature requirement protein LtrA
VRKFSLLHESTLTIIRYVVVCCEAAVIIAISCVERVVNFKHTHLVERVGLLTLIIMGEGIIGMTKSVAILLQHSTAVSASDIGVVIAAVLLIVSLVNFGRILYF